MGESTNEKLDNDEYNSDSEKNKSADEQRAIRAEKRAAWRLARLKSLEQVILAFCSFFALIYLENLIFVNASIELLFCIKLYRKQLKRKWLFRKYQKWSKFGKMNPRLQVKLPKTWLSLILRIF